MDNSRAFVNYDSWLEAPYQQMMDESDRYYEWAEASDLDPDSEETLAAYDDFLLEMAETWAEEQAERDYDRLEWEYEEMEDWYDESF